MTAKERDALIDRYAEGAEEVRKSLEGFPPDRLTTRAFPGKWTAAEIVHHLSDSETVSGIRLRRLLAEERPVINGYDQDEYARLLRYQERPIEPSFENFRAVRATTTQLLRLMSEADWQRQGWHSESGAYTAETWLQIYAVHAHNHAAQIRRLRDAVK
jgi:DinB superfamily